MNVAIDEVTVRNVVRRIVRVAALATSHHLIKECFRSSDANLTAVAVSPAMKLMMISGKIE